MRKAGEIPNRYYETYGPAKMWLVKTARPPVRLFMRAKYGKTTRDVSTLEEIKANFGPDKPIILAPNHRHDADVVEAHMAAASVYPEHTTYFAAKHELPGYLDWLGAIAIKRGDVDKDGLNNAMQRCVQYGGVVGVYPEATRVRSLNCDTGEEREVHRIQEDLVMPGVLHLAYLLNALIVPVGIAGLSDRDQKQPGRRKKGIHTVTGSFLEVTSKPVGDKKDRTLEDLVVGMQNALDRAYDSYNSQ